MLKSFELDPYNPLTLKYMADHYFFVKEYTKSESLCKRGLKLLEVKDGLDGGNKAAGGGGNLGDYEYFRKDIEYLKSDLFFILGKIYHVNER